MRIVSLNAWGGALADELLPWLAVQDADVVCLQEVTRTPGLSGWTRFADGERTLAQRADLFADVRGVLGGHQATFVASDAGPVQDADAVSYRQDFGLGVFVAGHLPVIGLRSTFVHGDFVDHERWATVDRPRVAVATRIVDRAAGRVVTVVHLHGLRDPAGKHDTPARRQARRLVELITGARRPGDLVVVCGDLNLLPGSDTFAALAAIGLTDLVGTADTRTARYRKPSRHASYLLVSDPAAVRDFQIRTTPEVSDHRPLVLDI